MQKYPMLVVFSPTSEWAYKKRLLEKAKISGILFEMEKPYVKV